MQYIDFLARTQRYYGLQYPVDQRNDIFEYLSQFSEEALGFLYTETRRLFSTRWKTLPDCAIWEEYRGAVQLAIKDGREAETRSDRMLEDKSEYLPREEVAEILGNFAEKMGGKV